MGLAFEELQHHTVYADVHPAHPLAKARLMGLEQISENA
jgi:hypothetical protein